MAQRRSVDGDRLVITDENGTALLSIQEIMEAPAVTLKLAGSITMNLAHDFEDELTSVATIRSQINLDFSEVDSISSAGLKALLSLQQLLDKRPDSRLRLCSLSKSVEKTFRDMGFIELFEIES